ncbi:hypothetical protein Dimus_025557 [Dionaea muscipula]
MMISKLDHLSPEDIEVLVWGFWRRLSCWVGIMGLTKTLNHNEVSGNGFHVVRHTSYPPLWFDLRVFYVRLSNFVIDDSTPESLTLNHIPLDPDTLLEVNGSRCSIHSDGMPSLLRRDRVDKKSEEATFVSTDSIRLTGSVKFEVFNKEQLVLTGILEMPNCNNDSIIGELKESGTGRQWSLSCESEIVPGKGFLKGKHNKGPEYAAPAIELYIAGSFSGAPVILTKTLQLSSRKKINRKAKLDTIPEYETTESSSCHKYNDAAQSQSSVPLPNGLDLQVAEYGSYKRDDEEYLRDVYWRRADYMEGEDGELSWFNAGVRVGVGIGLGICLGVGLGVGVLVRTYQSTTRNFRRRLL